MYSPWVVMNIDVDIPFLVDQDGDVFSGVTVGPVDTASMSIK